MSVSTGDTKKSLYQKVASELLKTMQRRDAGSPGFRDRCWTTCRTWVSLEGQQKNLHVCSVFRCLRCKKRFSLEDRERHMASCDDWPCRACYGRFSFKEKGDHLAVCEYFNCNLCWKRDLVINKREHMAYCVRIIYFCDNAPRESLLTKRRLIGLITLFTGVIDVIEQCRPKIRGRIATNALLNFARRQCRPFSSLQYLPMSSLQQILGGPL
jgi:hypothetical protein